MPPVLQINGLGERARTWDAGEEVVRVLGGSPDERVGDGYGSQRVDADLDVARQLPHHGGENPRELLRLPVVRFQVDHRNERWSFQQLEQEQMSES